MAAPAIPPTAVLKPPVVQPESAPAPRPVLKLPVVSLDSERQPTAVFAVPVVMLKRAWSPSAVFNPGKAASGPACAFSKRGKQTSPERIAANMTFRFFIDLGLFFHFFWAFSDFPVRAARHSQGESGTILIMSSHLLIFVAKRFAK